MEVINKSRNSQNVVILGDFNVNLSNEEEDINVNNIIFKDVLLDSLPIEGFTQVIKKNTRHCSNAKSSLIDHIWIKNMSKFIQAKQNETSSDHDLVQVIMKIKGNVATNTAVRSRDYRKFNIDEYLTELCGLNWMEIYDKDDPTLIAAAITENLCIPLNYMTPIKLRNLISNKTNGVKLSKETLTKMKWKDNLRSKAKATNNYQDWED